MNITNVRELFASFIYIYMWNFFVLIQMPIILKYHIIKLPFSRNFAFLERKTACLQAVFLSENIKRWLEQTKYFLSKMYLSKWQKCCSCSKRRFIFSIENTIRKMSLFDLFCLNYKNSITFDFVKLTLKET